MGSPQAGSSSTVSPNYDQADRVGQTNATTSKVRRLIPAARLVVLRAHDYDGPGAKPACGWDDPADIERVVT